MMYQDKLACAVKVDGKVLREMKDTVYVPFGTEYSLFVKNLNSVRVRVNIEIDGKDIADGNSFIIGAGQSMDLERFLKNGNMKKGNRFKFIERTAKVKAHRGGIQAEDGLVRISYEFEREAAPFKQYYPVWEPVKPYNPSPMWYGSVSGSLGGSSVCSNNSAGDAQLMNMSVGSASAASYTATSTDGEARSKSAALRSAPQAFVNQVADAAPKNEAGVTAAGSISDQQFHSVSDIYGDGVKHVMVLRLLGEVGQAKVQQAVTVHHRPVCESCGKVNKATSKFCSECGTSLEIV